MHRRDSETQLQGKIKVDNLMEKGLTRQMISKILTFML